MPAIKKESPSAAANSAPPNAFQVVAIGCSAGGLNTLIHVLGALKPDFPCSILVVQHLSPDKKSLMAELLGRASSLPVKQAENEELLLPGVVYIAPPDHHLLVSSGHVHVARSKPLHFQRPSVDLLFQSVAEGYGPRAVGVILSGNLKDGSAGIQAIKEQGGSTIAQDPKYAEHPSMARAAIATGCIDQVLPLDEIGPALEQLCNSQPHTP